MRKILTLLLVTSIFSGCLSERDLASDNATPPVTGENGVDYRLASSAIQFGEPILIDSVRPGGEPVILVTPEGTILVAAHPGWTHVHPSAENPLSVTDVATGTNLQSNLWRSTDSGASWEFVGLLGETGPRSGGLGFSDPDFTMDGNGRVYYTDLIALVHQSVSSSGDGGATWDKQTPLVGGPQYAYVDRQWMAAHGDKAWVTANYFENRDLTNPNNPNGHRPIFESTDGGSNFNEIGYAPCGGDFLADPTDGALIMACGLSFAISTDEGRTWEIKSNPAGEHNGFFAHEPAIDTSGGIYLAVNGQPLTGTSPQATLLTYSPDRGESWVTLDLLAGLQLESEGAGTNVFAWVTAGDQGKAVVTWLRNDSGKSAPNAEGEWYPVVANVDFNSATPTVGYNLLRDYPVHSGPMCQSGTTCQVNSLVTDPITGQDVGDRRMGDFFEATVDREGRFIFAVSNTMADPTGSVSHPQFYAQSGGWKLFSGEIPAGWPTQG